jgi:hypothetical protein
VFHSIFKSLVLLLLVTLVLLCLNVVFENHLLLVRLRLILHDIINSVLIIVSGLELIGVLISSCVHSII